MCIRDSGWTKWNNNAGAVDGKYVHKPLDVKYELAHLNDALTTLNLCDDFAIEEGSEGEGQ